MNRRTFLQLAGASALTVATMGPSAWARPAFRPRWMGYDIEGDPFVSLPSAAIERASEFDFLVAQPETYADWFAAMVDENPALGVGVYINLMHSRVATFPEHWYVYDRYGNVATGTPPWTENLLMNPLSAGWIAYQLDAIAGLLVASHYNRLYIDGGGLGPLATPNGAIDPRTGAQWTPKRWLDAMEPIWAKVNDTAGRPTWANNLGDATTFYTDGSQRMLPYFSRVFTESYLRGSHDSIFAFPSPARWLTTVNIVRACGSAFTGMTKLWTPNRTWRKDRWHAYALASYMVTGVPGSAFYCTYERADTVTPKHPWWSFADTLGPATGPFDQPHPGLYARRFDQGRVVVNVTDQASSLRLHRAMVDQWGDRHAAGTLRVDPHQGLLLRRAA